MPCMWILLGVPVNCGAWKVSEQRSPWSCYLKKYFGKRDWHLWIQKITCKFLLFLCPTHWSLESLSISSLLVYGRTCICVRLMWVWSVWVVCIQVVPDEKKTIRQPNQGWVLTAIKRPISTDLKTTPKNAPMHAMKSILSTFQMRIAAS